jgi:predicted aldo/keto reductase-like oxidoreductase
MFYSYREKLLMMGQELFLIGLDYRILLAFRSAIGYTKRVLLLGPARKENRMHEKKDKKILTRKQFLQTSAGIFTAGLFRSGQSGSSGSPFLKISLGRTGLTVTPICFGASRTQEPALVKTVLDRGINFLDTGRSYSNGQNEVMLGAALKGRRNQVVIQSKARLQIDRAGKELQSAEAADKIIKQLDNSLNASLKALQTDYIDILLYHSASSYELLYHDAVLNFFNRAKTIGKIRASGFSIHNDYLDVFEKASDDPVYDVVMVPYNYKGSYIHSLSGIPSEWDQPRLERSLKKYHDKKTAVIVMKTCSAGPFGLSDSDKPTYRDAIKWVLKKDYIDCAAVAMLNFDQIEEDLSALDK